MTIDVEKLDTPVAWVKFPWYKRLAVRLGWVQFDGYRPLAGKETRTPIGTASIMFLTATPGSGKTLRALELMDQAMSAGDKVYACNINGLCLPGVMPWANPEAWRDLPAGAVLFVDEAQEFFPDQRSTPEYILAMSRIRHYGVRLVIITQEPGYIHSHIRGLCGRHEHLLRKFGGKKSIIYRTEECMDNPKSVRSRLTADKESWAFPTQYYQFYKSAEVHTHKFQLPTQARNAFVLLAIGALLVGKVGYSLYQRVTEDPHKVASAAGGGTASASEPGSAAGRASTPQKAPMDAESWASRFTPRVPEFPASAPAYDSRQVVATPRLYCMASQELGSTAISCSCATEQGTRYLLAHDRCLRLARWGSGYDPFKAPQGELGGSTGAQAVQVKTDAELELEVQGRDPTPVALPPGAPIVRSGVLNESMTPLTLP